MTFFQIAWTAWAGLFVLLETWAIIRTQEGDTLSEQVWNMRGTGWFSLLIFLLLWAIWHFIFDGKK